MKVLLVPPIHQYERTPRGYLSVTDFPIGFAYIASSLKKAGHEVIGLDLNNVLNDILPYNFLMNSLRTAIREHKPDLIGLGGLVVQFEFLKDAFRIIRMITDTPIVLGGNIVSKDADYIFKRFKPDYAILGEGERAIVELADGKELSKIDNLVWWDGDKAVFNPTNFDYGDIDDLPFPDYDTFRFDESVDKFSYATRVLYRYTRTHPRPFVLVSARGCPFSCSFCIHGGGPRYRPRSIPNVMAEIEVAYKRYNFNVLILSDELFAANKKRLTEFCEALLLKKAELGWDFDWAFQTHASANFDEATLRLAKKAGCYIFSYGIESASPVVLESMGKKLKIEQVIKGIKLAEKVGIGFSGNLLYGDPAETDETFQDSLDFWTMYGQNNLIFLTVLEPYPGSRLFDYCLEKGIIKDRDSFYANLGNLYYNMTAMDKNQWMRWMGFIEPMETLWLFIKSTEGRVSPVGEFDIIADYQRGALFTVTAECPHCGEEIKYRECITGKPRFMGTGCTSCHRRVKIYLKWEDE